MEDVSESPSRTLLQQRKRTDSIDFDFRRTKREDSCFPNLLKHKENIQLEDSGDEMFLNDTFDD